MVGAGLLVRHEGKGKGGGVGGWGWGGDKRRNRQVNAHALNFSIAVNPW